MNALLANGIGIELVLLFGVIVLAPVILLIALAESLVFRVVLAAPYRRVFVPVLAANMLSTLAGVVVFIPVEATFGHIGRTHSVPDLVRAYPAAALTSIAAYFAFSVLAEAAWLRRRVFRTRVQRSTGRILSAVLVANLCTYLVRTAGLYLRATPRRPRNDLRCPMVREHRRSPLLHRSHDWLRYAQAHQRRGPRRPRARALSDPFVPDQRG